MTTAPATTPADRDRRIVVLERMLRAQLEGHERLGHCLARKREAIRTADIEAITAVCREEQVIVERLAEVEKQRLQLIGVFTQEMAPRAARPLTVREIAAGIEPERGGPLLELADTLKKTVSAVRGESAIVREAAEALGRHMAGLMQTVRTALAGAGTYGRGGRLAAGTPVRSGLDVKT